MGVADDCPGMGILVGVSGVSSKPRIFDLSKLDLNRVVADQEEVRRQNPQRFEMEQLNGVLYEDPQTNTCVGYKDVTHDEFWVRDHMPGMPLMPGVVMLEACAQLCSYFAHKYRLMGDDLVIGFGGLEEVRFRDPVLPGCRLYLLSQLTKIRRGRLLVSAFEGVVGDSVVVEGVLKGIPIPTDMLQLRSTGNSG